MSGHSKWSNIKRTKAANDAKKSAVFTKIGRLITVAAKRGGDPESNPSLRLAIEKAKAARMPKENIERAILKGSGGAGGADYEEVIYEGYGPEGVAFYIKALTDNKNRTVAEVRNILSRAGGSMGGVGTTAYIFGSDPENPAFEVEVSAEEVATRIINLVEALEGLDDVSDVFFNANISEELLEKL